MAIVRNPNRENWAVIDNRVLNDQRLSWRARGVLAYLLSKPDGWEVMKQNLINESPDGRKVVEATLSELETFGYIEHGDQPRGEGGRFDAVTTVVHEEPLSGFPSAKARTVKAQVAPRAETCNGAKDQFGTDVLLPRAEEPLAEEPRAEEGPRVKTELSITEEMNTEGERGSPVSASENRRELDEALVQDAFIAASALQDSMSLLWPNQNQGQVNFRIGQVTERIRQRCGTDEVPFALAAMAEILQHRCDLTSTGRAEPAKDPKFMLGVADQLIENWERDGVWEGAYTEDLAVSWNEFLYEHRLLAS